MSKRAMRTYHKFHGLGGDGFTKDTRTSEEIWETWHKNFGEFSNLQGARQSIWEITDAVRVGRAAGNPANLYDCGHRFAHHAQEQAQLAKDAGTLNSLLEGVWTGDAAAVARSRFDEFVTATNTTAEVLKTNADNLDTQAEQFRTLSERMQYMPPIEQTRQELFSEGRWTCDSVWEWQDQYGGAATANKELYDEYHVATQQNIGQVGADYGTVRPLSADAEVALPQGVAAPPVDSGSGGPGGYDSGLGGLGGSGHLPPSDATRAAGLVSPSGGASGFGGGAGAGSGPGGSAAVGGLAGAGGLAAAGGLAGAGRLPGALGGGVPGTSSGAAGRGGAGGGMGGGAGGGRGGKQGEDEEYRGRSLLSEDDPNGLFGLEEPTVPPVIGAD
jgi:uncharacterized protein YukE